MVWIIGIILLIVSLVICMVTGIGLSWGLLIGAAAFYIAARRSGFAAKEIWKMMWSGIRESFIVVGVLLLIGAMTGIWRACGTVQLLVSCGIRLIHPKLFLLFCFLLPAAISYLIGTSFGTSATIGVVLMTLCSVSGGNRVLAGGAILSGIYFGDRASPASSCAHLVAHLTGTEIYDNVRRMIREVLPAAALTTFLYFVLSFIFPLPEIQGDILEKLQTGIRLTPLLLIPPLIVLAAPLLKVNIRYAMGASVLTACVLAVCVQGMPVSALPGVLISGYKAEGELGALLSGGGVLSMMECNLMLLISATFSGIFNGTKVLDTAEEKLEKAFGGLPLYGITALTSFPVIMFSCSQTLALMLQVPLLRPMYDKRGISPEEFMLDLADTTVMFSGVVPWCLAFSNPSHVLNIGPVSILCAFFMYLPALFRGLHVRRSRR